MTEIARDVARRLFEQIPALEKLRGFDRMLAEDNIEREVELGIVDYLRGLHEDGDRDA